MKYLTLVVPCYNSEEYMERCIDSLLVGDDDVEIIIIDDGSTDRTGEIAAGYQLLYPDIVRAVHKENGGHGSGVNKGLELATGVYFKVVDSDDWLEKEPYLALLERMKEFWWAEDEKEGAVGPDLFVCNYAYNHLEKGTVREVNYNNIFPVEKMCGWNDIKSFRPSQYLIMHALIYRTQLLKQCGVVLPEHTFYVDNIFAYQPLPSVKNIYYMDINLYQYYLGREDQSVNERVLMSRIDQQMKVTKIVAECVDLNVVEGKYPKLADYMRRNISIMMAISSIHLLLIETKEAEEKRKALWNNIKKKNRGLYYRLKYTTISGFTYLPGKLGGKITIRGYRLAKKIYQFQ